MMNFSFSQQSLADQARRHWKEFQPTKYRDLKAAGQLEAASLAAANLTLQAMEADRAAGYSQLEAWELERERWLLLPEERGLPQEKSPHNPAFAALGELNRLRDEQALED